MKKEVLKILSLLLFCSILMGCTSNKESRNSIGAESIIGSFKDADIPISYYIIYDEINDPNYSDVDYLE